MATAPFAFLPRVVSRYAKPWQGISRSSPSPDPTISSESGDDDDSNTEPSSEGKGKGRAVEPTQLKLSTLLQDIASLIALALSDYNIWLDSDLRSKLEVCLNNEASHDDAGFVPVNYLLRRVRGLLPFSRKGTAQCPEPSETDAVKALRTHAVHILEVRMRLPSNSSSVWYGSGKTSRKKDVGGYEVRRKDWSSLRTRPSRRWTRRQWDDLTIYMEGIPPPYRTIGGVARLAGALLPSGTEAGRDVAPCLYVQHVTLPPHYLDKPGDIPKCKGYALVTFLTQSHVEALLRTWPWTRRRARAPKGEDEPQVVKDALKHGLRTISKGRWDALNEEYLAYKQSLVDEINAHAPEEHLDTYSDEQQWQACGGEMRTERRTTLMSSYPFNCLVFVRNVHPETNRTTLKALFGHAFQEDVDKAARTRLGGTGLDYVDFHKGMDTCYLRVASPQHATCLITYFSERGVAQADGLDAMGRAAVQGETPIAMEMVQGTKEALYWEKVPEKVRKQAVDKVVKASAESSSTLPTTHTTVTHASERKKRTREP